MSRISLWQEVTFIKQALFPVLMCHAASRGDIDAMEELYQQVISEFSDLSYILLQYPRILSKTWLFKHLNAFLIAVL